MIPFMPHYFIKSTLFPPAPQPPLQHAVLRRRSPVSATQNAARHRPPLIARRKRNAKLRAPILTYVKIEMNYSGKSKTHIFVELVHHEI